MSKAITKEDLLQIAEGYLRWDSHGPFLIAFDTMDDLSFLIQELSSCEKVLISDYCLKPDSTADLDKLFNDLNEFAKAGKQILLLGVGEHTLLLKDDGILNKLKNFLNSNRKLIVPIWQGYKFLDKLTCGDLRWNRMIHFLPQSNVLWSYKRIAFDLPQRIEKQLFEIKVRHGFKALLATVEKGCKDVIPVRTALPLNNDYGQIFSSSYEFYCVRHPNSGIPKTMFSEEQWTLFLDEERKPDIWPLSADSLLDILENDSTNIYMQSVVDGLQSYDEFEEKFAQHIFEIPDNSLHEKNDFSALNRAMKELLRDDTFLQKRFIEELRKHFDPPERLHYLCGDTLAEKKEILAILPLLKDLPSDLETLCQQLYRYLHQFTFTPEQISLENKSLCMELSCYFQEYKKQKILNRIFPEFLQKIEKIPASYFFNLPSRGTVLERIRKNNAKLIWIDALGCEFLAYLQCNAQDRGLHTVIHIGVCTLPSITSLNRAFYDQWNNGIKEKIERLDRIKHGEDEEIRDPRCKDAAVHLASELQVLDGVLEEIEHDLKHGGQKKVVLTSDHGASRLAVIIDPKSITMWEMTESGEHSGRCCKKNECDQYVTPPQELCRESDDGTWYVLANYDRFKGSRQGLIEVHGGATLEEVLVPIIEFTLPNALEEPEQDTPASQSIALPKSIALPISLKQKIFKKSPLDKEITLYLVSPEKNLQGAEVHFRGKQYLVQTDINGFYVVRIPAPRPGSYSFDISIGQEKIKELQFTIESPLKINPDFDF